MELKKEIIKFLRECYSVGEDTSWDRGYDACLDALSEIVLTEEEMDKMYNYKCKAREKLREKNEEATS